MLYKSGCSWKNMFDWL